MFILSVASLVLVYSPVTLSWNDPRSSIKVPLAIDILTALTAAVAIVCKNASDLSPPVIAAVTVFWIDWVISLAPATSFKYSGNSPPIASTVIAAEDTARAIATSSTSPSITASCNPCSRASLTPSSNLSNTPPVICPSLLIADSIFVVGIASINSDITSLDPALMPGTILFISDNTVLNPSVSPPAAPAAHSVISSHFGRFKSPMGISSGIAFNNGCKYSSSRSRPIPLISSIKSLPRSVSLIHVDTPEVNACSQSSPCANLFIPLYNPALIAGSIVAASTPNFASAPSIRSDPNSENI